MSMEQVIISALSFMVVSLLGVIGFFAKRRMDDQDARMEKHEKWIINQQKELTQMAQRTDKAIELIQQNQEHDRRRLELFEKLVMKIAS